jgi:myo-inositol-1-phosphate synthase
MSKIKLAIVGVGNCASSLIQGINYYSKRPLAGGLMYQKIGPYEISDIEIVAAFDIDKRKVGSKISNAIFSEPNCTIKFSEVDNINVTVQKGHVLDGIASHMNG